MRFAINEAAKVIGADEAMVGEVYRCADCASVVARSDADGQFHHIDSNATPAQCSAESLKQAARQQLRLCDRIRLPALAIRVTYPQNHHRPLQEDVVVTEERQFMPFGAELNVATVGGVLDVLYEAGEWRLGVILTAAPEEKPNFDTTALARSRMGVLAVDVGMLPLVAEGRSWREQLTTGLAFGLGNKHWLYHPREARIRAEWAERLERKWAFKQYARQQAPTSVEGPARGTPQIYRCACGEKWMGRVGIEGRCPNCGMPSTGFSVPVGAEEGG